MIPHTSPLVIFDGLCNVCDRSVQFLLRHERRPELSFAAAQSEAGRAALMECGLSPEGIDTVVLIENGTAYLRSEAALRLVRYLKASWWPLLFLFILPKPLRDWCYDCFAEHRYRWFGKKDRCMVPTPEVASRFLS